MPVNVGRNTMKKANEYTANDVKSRAIKLMTSTHAVLQRGGNGRKYYRLDFRFNFDRAVWAYMKSHPLSESQKAEILAKKKERAKNKNWQFQNVLSNPLVKDFKNNRHSLSYIDEHRLCFHGRNHWAKNNFDRKILSILLKTFPVIRL